MYLPPCPVCTSSTTLLFEGLVLHKYLASYVQCTHCRHVHVPNAHWLSEAYTEAIADMDTGILERNIKQRRLIRAMLWLYFPKNPICIDYGGGYGIFTRLMRDSGISYYWQDQYSTNLFAKKFVATSPLEPQFRKYDLLTAFEVLEHLPDPVYELKRMAQYSDTLIFTTLLVPKEVDAHWWVVLEYRDRTAYLFLYQRESEHIGTKYGYALLYRWQKYTPI